MGPVHEVVAHECVLRAEDLCEHSVKLVASVIAVTVAGSTFEVHITDAVVDKSFQHLLTVASCCMVNAVECFGSIFLRFKRNILKFFIRIEITAHFCSPL